MDQEEFRRLGHALVDWIADYRERAGTLPVMSQTKPGEIRAWFHLVDEGVAGMQARIRRDLENARWLAAQVDAAPGRERLAPVPLQTVCARHVPQGERDPGRLAAHNLAIADRVNRGGLAYVTPSVGKGSQLIRVSIGSARTERADVEGVWEALQGAARA